MGKTEASPIMSKGDIFSKNVEGRVPIDDRGLMTSVKMTVAFIASSVIFLLALRNTVTYHLQHFWGASGDFWQLQWDRVMEICGNDYFNVLVYAGTLSSYMVYCVVGGIYTIMDVTGKPAFLRPYKVQPGTNEPVPTRKLLKCIALLQFNLLIIGPMVSVATYWLAELRGCDKSPSLPTFQWVLFELAICILVEEVGFYYSHRLFHHRHLYRYFHKIHHEWQSPISITALYAHPLEHVLSNLAPALAGPLILGSHPATTILWTSLATFTTLTSHSGYHLPFCMSPEFHDYHHLKFNQCFGVLGILDHLHGTDDKFRASKCYARNTTMLTFIPARQMFPDDDTDEKTKDKQQ